MLHDFTCIFYLAVAAYIKLIENLGDITLVLSNDVADLLPNFLEPVNLGYRSELVSVVRP